VRISLSSKRAASQCLAALDHGAHAVIGTSGLSESDYADLAAAAEAHKRAVLAVGNFALTAVLLQRFAEIAARLIPQWEIIDYASDGKQDAPSGRPASWHSVFPIRPPNSPCLSELRGSQDRGADLQVRRFIHPAPGMRSPSRPSSGMPDQMPCDASGGGAQPYVDGAASARNTFVDFAAAPAVSWIFRATDRPAESTIPPLSLPAWENSTASAVN
jgi:4-hydroxy-tetrahydrodipicolinate reductase